MAREINTNTQLTKVTAGDARTVPPDWKSSIKTEKVTGVVVPDDAIKVKVRVGNTTVAASLNINGSSKENDNNITVAKINKVDSSEEVKNAWGTVGAQVA